MSLKESLKDCRLRYISSPDHKIIDDETLEINDYLNSYFDEERLICNHLIINGKSLNYIGNIHKINILEVNTSNMILTISNMNSLEKIILGKDCKNVNIFGEFDNLKEIICLNDLTSLNFNCKCKQKLIIQNKNIKTLNFSGHYNDFIELNYDYLIDNIIYNDFFYNINALNIYYNTTFSGNIDKNIETLNICYDCNINGLFDNIKTINIMKECKEVILNGIYNNLKDINFDGNLDYLELKGNFKQRINIYNKIKYIKTLKFSGILDYGYIYFSRYVIEIIYENYNLSYSDKYGLHIYNNTTFINCIFNTIFIEKNIIINNISSTISNIIIQNKKYIFDCYDITLNGVYPNLKKITCNCNLEHFYLNGIFNSSFIIVNKNIDYLTLNHNITSYSITNKDLIKNIILI